MPISDYIQTVLSFSQPHSGHQILSDEASSAVTFIGEAISTALTSDASWRIARVLRVGTLYSIEYANNGAYDQIWDNRASLFPAGSLTNTISRQYDGVNDYDDFGNNYTFEVSQAFSVSLWVKPNNLAATRCLVSKCSNDANVYGYNIQHLITTGRIQLQMRSSGGTFPVHSFTSALTAGVWQHLVVTYAGGSNINGARCYINAVVGDTPGSSVLSGSFSNTASFILGARNTAFPYSGLIDEVTVWNKALSAAEVTELYNSGQPLDPNDHSAAGNCVSWWRMGDNDTYPTILDNKGSVNGTMQNSTSSDFVADVP